MSQSTRTASIKVALIPFAYSLDQALVFSIVVLCETENLLASQYIYVFRELYIYICMYIDTDLYIEKYKETFCERTHFRFLQKHENENHNGQKDTALQVIISCGQI